MLLSLTNEQRQWVDETLDSMTLPQLVGQLLCPVLPTFTADDWIALLQQVPLGAMFIFGMPEAPMRGMLAAIQKAAPVPLLVAGDLEHGATAVADAGTEFPWMMAAGAANDAGLMFRMGRATAAEARYAGLHWTFAPVVDLNYNFQNPITNIRALGDEPERVQRLATAFIRGVQQDGLLAATAKHFPGDGMDDRDQHLVTTLNTLPVDQWRQTYGRVWQSVIEAGVMSVMAGHVAFPDYQGFAGRPLDALPATLSRKLQVELLRDELGFQGVLTSDASPMNGIAARVPYAERAIRNIEAGSDVYLFPNPVEEFGFLLTAAQNGRLPQERIRQSARRILELKARLNLHQDPFGPKPTDVARQSFRAAAQTMADKSVTLLRSDGRPPLKLSPGANLLTVTIGNENLLVQPHDLDVFDAELRQRGYVVNHLVNPGGFMPLGGDELRDKVGEYEAVFINLYTTPMMMMGTIRTVEQKIVPSWRAIFADNPHIVFTTFGNPYVLYELPYLPNLVATYGGSAVSQKAAVKVWLGEMEAQGDCPVQMPTVLCGEILVRKEAEIAKLKDRPSIVCLCGSTRFWRTFQEASLKETLAGKIVLSIGAASGTDDDHFGNLSREEYDRVKAELDELHLRKIDLADEVLILNVDGYIGESTGNELRYAMSQKKLIRFWQDETAPDNGRITSHALDADGGTV